MQQRLQQLFTVVIGGFDTDPARFDINADLLNAIELAELVDDGICTAAALDVFYFDNVFHKFSANEICTRGAM